MVSCQLCVYNCYLGTFLHSFRSFPSLPSPHHASPRPDLKNPSHMIFQKTVSKIARFQPIHGRLLAAGNDNKVKLFDTTTQQEVRTLQGHTRPIHSISWHPQTPKMATGSDDCVAVWDAANPARPLRSLSVSNISSCGFHPSLRSVVVIGSYQRVYLWDFESEKTVTIPAHEGIVSGLSSSFVSGLFATASHDSKVKLFC